MGTLGEILSTVDKDQFIQVLARDSQTGKKRTIVDLCLLKEFHPKKFLLEKPIWKISFDRSILKVIINE